MKLRVKFASGSADVLRVEVSGSATGQQLREAVLQALPASAANAAADVVLSLNKKTPLQLSDSDTVSSLGLCNGDTVWILGGGGGSGGGSEARAAAPTPGASADTAGDRSAGKMAAAGGARPVVEAPQGPVAMDVEFYARVGEPSDAVPAADGSAAPERVAQLLEPPAECLQAVPEPAGPPAPDLLLRILDACAAASATSGGSGRGVSPHQLLALAAHAAMLESGFSPASGDGSVQQLSICAQPAASLWSCDYQLPPAATSAAATAAGGSSSGSGGSAVATTTTPSISLPRVHVKYAVMGPHVLVHGAVAGAVRAKGAATVQLAAQEHLAPTALHRWQQQQQGLPRGAQAFSQLPATWRQLKDGLALPLLMGAHTEAGLPPPLGLLTLPADLKDAVLRLLRPRDLAAASAACTALRHLASEDALWLRLFESEFPDATPADRSVGQRRGWKHAFALKWLERRERAERQRLSAQVRAAHPRRGGPAPAPMPWGPVYPSMPAMPAGVVGGDYDRLPMPMMGMGPGAYRLGPGSLGGGGGGGGVFGGGLGGGGALGGGMFGGGLGGGGGGGGPRMPGAAPSGPFQGSAFRTRGGGLGFP